MIKNILFFIIYLSIPLFIGIRINTKRKGYSFISYIKRYKAAFIGYLVFIIACIIYIYINDNRVNHSLIFNYNVFYEDSIPPSKYHFYAGGGTEKIILDNKEYKFLLIENAIYDKKNYVKYGFAYDTIIKLSKEGYLIEKKALCDTFYLRKDNDIKCFVIKEP